MAPLAIKVLLPAHACLECSWGPQHYQALATEYPCYGPLPSTSEVSPLLLGQTAGALMAATGLALLTGNGPVESTDLTCDLLHQRFLNSRLPICESCRCEHYPVTARVPIGVSWNNAMLGDMIATAQRHFGSRDCRVEFRRFNVPGGLFGNSQHGDSSSLAALADRPVESLGIRSNDYVRAWASNREDSVMLQFSAG